MLQRFPIRLMTPMTFGLGVTMTIGYGTLYYPFAILGPEIARDLGWSESFVFGVFSLALLASAFAASLAGRMLDRLGGRSVLMVGSLLAAMALVLLSLVESRPAFAAAVLVAEAVSCMALYEAGFAALTAIHGLGARRHITHVTLVAGFASTVFWPLIHWLLGFIDWRGVFIVLAVINLLVALPIHALLPRPGSTRARVEEESEPERKVEPGLLPSTSHRGVFLIMAIAFACGGFLMSAVHTSFFLLLEAMGRSAALAALAGAVIGPMQVGARLIEMLSGGRLAASTVGLISSAALLLGIVLLAVAWGVPGSLPVLLFSIAFGIGQGLSFIARAVLPARLFGTAAYGRITGNLAAVRLVFTAAGPFLAAFCISRFGAGAALALFGVMALIGLAAALRLATIERRAALRPA